MASRRDISGALDSATSVSAIDRRPTKGFDFRPRFSGYRNSGHSLVKAGNETQDLQPKYYGRLRSALSAGKGLLLSCWPAACLGHLSPAKAGSTRTIRSMQ